jgi:glycosyl transferase family 87
VATGGPINRALDRIIRRLAVLAVAALVLSMAILSFPARRRDPNSAIDFSIYYSAAQIVKRGLGRQLYDLKIQSTVQSEVAPVHIFYNHPPYEALFFLPFSSLRYSSAYIAWTLVSVFLLSFSTYLIARTTAVREALSRYTRLDADSGLLFAVFLTFGPVITCLLLGQDSFLLLTIYALALALVSIRRNFLAGCLLAMAMFKFHLVVPLVLVYALRRLWSLLAGATLATVFWLAVSVAISGTRVLIEYPRFLWFETRHPELAGFRPVNMPNVRGLVTWVSADRISPMGALIITVILSIAVLFWAAKAWNASQPMLSFSLALLASLLVSFHLYIYDLALILLPVSQIAGELARRGQLSRALTVNVSLCLLFIHPLHLFLLLHGLYAVMSVPIFVLFFNAAELSRRAHAGSVPVQALSSRA